MVEMHHFAGVTREEVAALGVTAYHQARQKWASAHAGLRHALGR
jgi:hypothetical protein